MAIQTDMNGKEIDRVLKAICDAENHENDGLLLYIRNGEIAFDTEDNLFTITPLT